MVLSNAERQRRYLARLKAAASGVTPDDINRARRIMFDSYAAEPSNRAPTWDDWLAGCRKARGRENWANMLPDSADPEMYEECGEDAALLAKVGAVVEAINKVSD